jgi:hypothetical protein
MLVKSVQVHVRVSRVICNLHYGIRVVLHEGRDRPPVRRDPLRCLNRQNLLLAILLVLTVLRACVHAAKDYHKNVDKARHVGVFTEKGQKQRWQTALSCMYTVNIFLRFNFWVSTSSKNSKNKIKNYR